MVAFVVPTARVDRAATVPRPRVAYIQPGDGDDFEWPDSRPNIYEADWAPRRRRHRRPVRRLSAILLAMSAVSAAAGGVLAIGDARQPTTAPVAVDAAFQNKPKVKVVEGSTVPLESSLLRSTVNRSNARPGLKCSSSSVGVSLSLPRCTSTLASGGSSSFGFEMQLRNGGKG